MVRLGILFQTKYYLFSNKFYLIFLCLASAVAIAIERPRHVEDCP